MKFTKMQGLGNDYVYVNCFEEKIENPSEVAIKVSNRNFGVGSDGLIMINPSKVADFEMEMYNADGSRGEMCGNGIRCVGKYVYDYGLTDKTSISVETLAGIKYLDFTVEDGKVKLVYLQIFEYLHEGLNVSAEGFFVFHYSSVFSPVCIFSSCMREGSAVLVLRAFCSARCKESSCESSDHTCI